MFKGQPGRPATMWSDGAGFVLDVTLAAGGTGGKATFIRWARLAKRGEVTLAGFYEQPLSFTFPPAFMREARIRIAAEFTREDLDAVTDLISSGRLNLSGLITDRARVADAPAAYVRAFTDPSCIKMALDWRTPA